MNFNVLPYKEHRMRCPSCEKFVSLELQEPESPDPLDVEYNGDEDAPGFLITGSIRIVRTCAECGDELKEATLDIEQEVELGENVSEVEGGWTKYAKEHDLTLAAVSDTAVESIEEGGGRYKKSYFGAQVTFEVVFGDKVVAEVSWSDKVAASQMDENG